MPVTNSWRYRSYGTSSSVTMQLFSDVHITEFWHNYSLHVCTCGISPIEQSFRTAESFDVSIVINCPKSAEIYLVGHTGFSVENSIRINILYLKHGLLLTTVCNTFK